jgi:glycerate 2-kinase
VGLTSSSERMIRNRARLTRNGLTPVNSRARHLCIDALESALRAVEPSRCLTSAVKVQGNRLSVGEFSCSLSRFGRIMLLGVGKAGLTMFETTARMLRDFDTYGILIAPKGSDLTRLDQRFERFQAGHPLPDQEGLKASKRVIQAVADMRESELLVCLISGGGSAMLPAPAEGISIQDKRTVTNQLVKSHATIHEINTVRRHLSRLKGGRLVQLCRASTILTLIMSDVPGNHLADIASGLTAEDPTSYHDAVSIMTKYNLWDRTPNKIKRHLVRGVRGKIPETPKPGSANFRRVHNVIIADNYKACAAAQRVLAAKHVSASVLASSVEMDSSAMGGLLAAIAQNYAEGHISNIDSRAVIFGGETTVTVSGNGKGGRNQECVLSAVQAISGVDGAVIAALGTDGVDGNSKAAGAIADGRTLVRARKLGITPQPFLDNNDSYRFFKALGDNLVTGPTGTNVSDLYVALLAK